jgi:mono/diheme cytochrome c family protein
MTIIPFPGAPSSLTTSERRKIHWFAGAVVLAVIWLLGWYFGVWHAAPALVSSAAQEPDGKIELATINQYCIGCHNERAKVGGLSLEGTTAASIAQRADVFEKAVRKLRGRVMPPPGAKQPEGAAVDSLVAFLETTLDRAETKARVSDRVVLHRLNRKEYSNAVRDLLAVDYDAAEVLPADDVAEGFDNIATALQVSPSFIEQYVIAARAVAVKAMGRPDARPGGWTFRSGAGTQLTHVPGLPLGTRGGILAKVDLPSDGEYIVDIADMATHIWGNGMEFENPLVVVVDNKIVYETIIGGEDDMKQYDQVQNGALDRVNARLKNIKFNTTAGPHKIGVAFKRRTFAESDDQLQMFTAGGGQDRLYRVQSFQVRGPFNAKGLSTTPSRDRIFNCKPAADATPDAQAVCAKKVISTLARRAYRRPVTADDVNELFQYYQDGVKAGGFEGGVRSAITGLLASPFFLYRAEHVPAGLRVGESYSISDLELASNLSFFLWNSIPDDELLQLASEGKLKDPAVLERQVKRMLADSRSITLASNFVHQWLDMKRLDEIVPDSAVFPYASGRSDPREDFRTELTLFSDSIFREDRSVVDLLRASHTYLNERVALHYGITDVKGDRFRRVELANSTRWGLLGKGAVLMAGRLSEPHIAGPAWQVRPRASAGRTARDAAARCADTRREGRRYDESAHHASDDGEASRQPDVRGVPRGDGPARHRARELRCDRHVARSRSLCGRGDRFIRRASRRHADQGPGRSAQGAVAAARTVRADVHRRTDDVRDRTQTGVLRHADRAPDRARGRGNGLPVLIVGAGGREERSIQTTTSATGGIR